MEQYIQPFVDVTTAMFKDMLNIDAIPERPHFAQRNDSHDWDMSAVIGLSGQVKGSVVISMKADLAKRLTGDLIGTMPETMDDDVVDAIGELVNIIAGNAKKGLEESYRIIIGLPAIVKGKKHQIMWPTEKARIICIPFRIYEVEEFYLLVAIEINDGGA